MPRPQCGTRRTNTDRGPSGPRPESGGMAMETKPRQIEFINEDIDNTNPIVFRDPVIQSLREKCGLIPAAPLDETRHVKPLTP